ncbi:MAG: histidine-type phosphatase [Bacteroidales bacterium]|nr:histidine-type phosphatase [Bacteroidales bacterium]
MKKILLLSSFFLSILAVQAQTAKEEIYADILKSSSNHMAYQAPTQPLTKSPKGYEPFYMTHYGRHGSRWLLNDHEYQNVIKPLRKAKEEGILTALGQETLEKMERFYPCTLGRLGELTDIGEIQHHGIGKRMTQNFPKVFSGKKAEVDARSTVVVRCIMSMVAECEEITAFNPELKMHNDVSQSYQWYLNHNLYPMLHEAGRDRGRINWEYQQKYTHPERFCRALFTDESYWRDEKFKAADWMRQVFSVTTNMQSHGCGEDMWNLFTKEEAYDLWKIVNIDWYLGYANAPQTGGLMQYNQTELLRNMIQTTDTVLASKTYSNGAALRFGHEVCVLPLACLMELDSCGRAVEDLDRLEDYWVNFRIYPMACNIQLVFYHSKKKKANAPILVKALLNEKEATLPVKTDQYPYYKWDDLRAYYMQKMEAFDEKLKAWEEKNKKK